MLQRLHALPLLLLVEEHLGKHGRGDQEQGAHRHVLLLLHQPEQVLIVHLLLEVSRLFKGLALHLLDLVRELQSLLTGEELDDGVGVEHVARVDLGQGVTFFLVCRQTIMAPALKKETAGKCLKVFFTKIP